jgi:hypothetical protein
VKKALQQADQDNRGALQRSLLWLGFDSPFTIKVGHCPSFKQLAQGSRACKDWFVRSSIRKNCGPFLFLNDNRPISSSYRTLLPTEEVLHVLFVVFP